MEGMRSIALGIALISSYAQSGGNATQGATPLYGQRYVSVYVGGGKTLVPLLGDEDPRRNFMAGVTYSKPEPRFRFKRKRADLLQEIYYEHSHSPGVSGEGPNDYEALGYLFGARYNWARGRYGMYFDLGWGFQLNNHATVDLPTRLNSTPFLDYGFYIPIGKQVAMVGLRLMHISNAHQKGSNQGQNQLFLTLGVQF